MTKPIKRLEVVEALLHGAWVRLAAARSVIAASEAARGRLHVG